MDAADESFQVIYLPDTQVDAQLDEELRGLLSTCFVGPVNECFRHQRFFHEMPQHRWLVRDASGWLVAHVALHDKRLGTPQGDLRVAGIAEVCVHPDFRGRGLVRTMLDTLHRWAEQQGFRHAALFGDEKVYRGSGYIHAPNPLRYWDKDKQEWITEPSPGFHVRPLTQPPEAFPDGLIDLRGPHF